MLRFLWLCNHCTVCTDAGVVSYIANAEGVERK